MSHRYFVVSLIAASLVFMGEAPPLSAQSSGTGALTGTVNTAGHLQSAIHNCGFQGGGSAFRDGQRRGNAGTEPGA